MSDMHDKIREFLWKLEERKDIRILLAVESGSRAWGFESKDSDWDVRFIYARPLQWYMSIDTKWDETLEGTGPDDIDYQGWNLPKALRLMYNANGAIHEWIHSPIVYLADDRFMDQMQMRSPEYFDPYRAMHHYRQLASGNMQRYITGNDEFKLKRVLYVWRATMVAKYIREFGTFPGTHIQPLLDESTHLHIPNNIQVLVDFLLAKKSNADELGVGTWEEFRPLVDYLNDELQNLEAFLSSDELSQINKTPTRLNTILRTFIR